MFSIPLQYRYAGLEHVGGRWRLYLVLPVMPVWRIRRLRAWGWSEARAAAALFLLVLASDQRQLSVPSGWQASLLSPSSGIFRIEQCGTVTVTALRARLKEAPFEITPFSSDRRQGNTASIERIVASFHEKTGRDVLGAVNGGFFDLKTGLPIGFLLRDGEMDFFNMPQGIQRSIVGFTRPEEGLPARVVISSPHKMPKVYLDTLSRSGARLSTMAVHHINVAGGRHAFALFTASYGAWLATSPLGLYVVVERATGAHPALRVKSYHTGAGRLPIPSEGMIIALYGDSKVYASRLPIGTAVRPRWTLPKSWAKKGVVHGLLAGPRLLERGHLAVTARQEHLSSLKSRDRIILGTTADGEASLVWLHQNGIKLSLDFDEAAQLLSSMGFVDAIALDGGGSRSLFAVARTAHTEERYLYKGRPVANALMLSLRPPPRA